MEYATIIYEEKFNYSVITLNRPEKLNALNKQMFDDIADAVTKIELNPNISALIITGSGEKAFAAGADISELNACDARSGKLFSKYGSEIMERIARRKIPVIAAVNGYALGGGCELTLACHIRFASKNAKFGQPEVNLGIIPGYGATQRLTRLVGKAKAMELIISAATIDAEEALRIGLVNSVFSKEELMQKTEEFVQLVLSKGKTAVSAAVECINMAEVLSVSDGLDYESDVFGYVCGSDDFKEGTNAFMEKRKANFK
jgi:enoyl-CoA hydratase